MGLRLYITDDVNRAVTYTKIKPETFIEDNDYELILESFFVYETEVDDYINSFISENRKIDEYLSSHGNNP